MVATVRVTPTATYSRRAREDLDMLIPKVGSCEVEAAAAAGTTPRARTTATTTTTTVGTLVVNGELRKNSQNMSPFLNFIETIEANLCRYSISSDD